MGKLAALAARFRAGLRSLGREGLEVRDQGSRLGGIVTFAVPADDAFSFRDSLAEQHVFVNVSQATTSQLDFGARGICSPLVRASFHYYHTEGDVDQALQAVAAVVRT